MLNKIVLLLSMTLNLVLALVVLDYNNKPLRTLNFRDAISDTPTTSQLMNNSLAGVTPVTVPPADVALIPPSPVAVAPVPADLAPVEVTATVSATAPEAAAAPVKPAAPVKTAALMIKGGNDWAAYKQDAAEDSDVFVSNVFRSRKNGEKAVAAAVKRVKARGKEVLFSCVLTEKSGGVFYVIRMATPSIRPPRATVATRWKSDAYSSDLGEITNQAESEIQVMY